MADENLARWGARLHRQVYESHRYHMRRASFYQSWHTFTQIIIALFGASAFVLLFVPDPSGGKPIFKDAAWVYSYVGFFVGLISVADLVLRISEKANQHEVLGRLFGDVLSEILARKATEQDLERLQERVGVLNGQEPVTVRRYVVAQCYNEFLIAHGFDDEYFIKFTWLQSLITVFAHFTNIGSVSLRPSKFIEENPVYYIEKAGIELAA